jgi:hypothetical protein
VTVQNKNSLIFYSSSQDYLFYDDGLTQEGNVDEYMQDVLTVLYYIRTLPLKIGVEYILDDRSGDSSWTLTVKILREETVRINLGRFNCFVIEPMVRKDAYTAYLNGRIVVWLTDDKRRIPVYMESESPLGLVNAVLKSADTNKKRYCVVL